MDESLRTYDESDSANTRWIAENIVDVDLTIVSNEECEVRWLDERVERYISGDGRDSIGL